MLIFAGALIGLFLKVLSNSDFGNWQVLYLNSKDVKYTLHIFAYLYISNVSEFFRKKKRFRPRLSFWCYYLLLFLRVDITYTKYVKHNVK